MFLSFLFSSDKKNNDIAGKWIDSDVSPDGVEYGFVLMPDGRASSISWDAPQYTAWRRSGGTLTLWGHARGMDENTKIEFIESLKIREITPDKLVLSRAEDTYTFNRG